MSRLNKRARSKRNVKTVSRVNRLRWREQGFEIRRERNRVASNQANFVAVPYVHTVDFYRDKEYEAAVRRMRSEAAARALAETWGVI